MSHHYDPNAIARSAGCSAPAEGCGPHRARTILCDASGVVVEQWPGRTAASVRKAVRAAQSLPRASVWIGAKRWLDCVTVWEAT